MILNQIWAEARGTSYDTITATTIIMQHILRHQHRHDHHQVADLTTPSPLRPSSFSRSYDTSTATTIIMQHILRHHHRHDHHQEQKRQKPIGRDYTRATCPVPPAAEPNAFHVRRVRYRTLCHPPTCYRFCPSPPIPLDEGQSLAGLLKRDTRYE